MLRLCRIGGELIRGTRCPVHQSTTARGYGTDHQRARRQLAEDPSLCGYCGGPIVGRWVAAHRVDGQPQYGYLRAHPACNERAKGGGAIRNG